MSTSCWAAVRRSPILSVDEVFFIDPVTSSISDTSRFFELRITSVPTVTDGWLQKAGARAKAGRKVALHVKLVSAHQKPVKGKVVIMRGTKVVHKAVKLVKGKVALVLTNQPKGLQTYTVHFKGNKKIAQVDKTLTVRVHK